MKKILLIAYSISPKRGSEYSVGWNHAIFMSKHYKITVIYGLAGDHMGDLEEIESINQKEIPENLKFIPVKPNFLAKILNYTNKNGFFVYLFYLAYSVWHRQLKDKIKEIERTDGDFDVYHYLCPIGFREPGYIWQGKENYVWGPVGGLDNQSIKISFQKSIPDGVKSTIKTSINKFQLLTSFRIKKAIKQSNEIIAATPESQKIIAKIRQQELSKVKIIPENAIPDKWIENYSPKKFEHNQILSICWVGTIDSRKSLEILLLALSKLSSKLWELNVVGSGPKKIFCQNLAEKLLIKENIKWHGKLPRHEVIEVYKNSHLHVITSLAEGNPTTLWEAMSTGTPTLCLENSGMKNVVCKKCGFKVPSNDIHETTNIIKTELEEIIRNPSIINEKTTTMLSCIKDNLWSARENQWKEIYEELSRNKN